MSRRMRLIDVDQIHHAKYHGIAEIYPSDVNIESYKRGWNDALDAVADPSCSPTIDAVPQWIPCSERLPEEGVVVVTVDKDGDYEINAIIDEEDCEWFWEKPVAWMPLPKPYEVRTE